MQGHDLNALAAALLGGGASAQNVAATSTVMATAVSDSTDGTVSVMVDGGVTTPDSEVVGEDAAAAAVELPTTQKVNEGDTVIVTVTEGHPVVTGVVGSGDTTDAKADAAQDAATDAQERATAAETAAAEAKEAASAVSQHFWDDDNGAHVSTEAKVAEGTRNAVWNTKGLLLRSGANNDASFTSGAVAFYDGEGNDAANVTAAFGADSATIGKTSEQHVELDADGLELYNGDGERLASLGKSSVTLGEQDEAANITMCGDLLTITSGDPKTVGNLRYVEMASRDAMTIKTGNEYTVETHAEFADTDTGTTVTGDTYQLGLAVSERYNYANPRAEQLATAVKTDTSTGAVVGTKTAWLGVCAGNFAQETLENEEPTVTATVSDSLSSERSTLEQTTTDLSFSGTINALGGLSDRSSMTSTCAHTSNGTGGMYAQWATAGATGRPSMDDQTFHLLGFEGQSTNGRSVQMAQATGQLGRLALRSTNASGTWGSWQYCVMANQNVKMFFGSVVKSISGDSVNMWTAAQFQSAFGVRPGNAYIGFMNGDGSANSVHVEGCTYMSGNVYAVFNKSGSGSLRVTYFVAAFS